MTRCFVTLARFGNSRAQLVLRRRTLELIDERSVDLLDVDAAVLHRLDGIGQLHQLARGGLGVGEWPVGDEPSCGNYFP
jgi:hypothetical protein